MSKRWRCVSRFGTSIHASTKPMTPTGRFTKKIHSHPRPSTSRPPASGPTSIATPEVAPHRPIAAPRCVGGKVRVMTAIVCGVMRDAPKPCTARNTMSIVSVDDSPHPSEASVKIASPIR